MGGGRWEERGVRGEGGDVLDSLAENNIREWKIEK